MATKTDSLDTIWHTCDHVAGKYDWSKRSAAIKAIAAPPLNASKTYWGCSST